MQTIAQAFDSMRQALELTDAEKQEAARQQNVVRENLRGRLGGVIRDILSGSFSRRTAIRPLDDIDLFIVLDPLVHSDVYPNSVVKPSACLRKVQRALAAAYPSSSAPRLQGRSVHIDFSGTGIGYDVVPAFAAGGEVYIIPDRGRDEWIRTNPEAHKRALIAANERAAGKLNPMVKMAKLWKRENGEPLRSFHLEVMSYNAFWMAPASYAEGMRALFGHLASAVLSGCADPAGVGPNIDAGMTQAERTAARAKLVEAERKAAEALGLERAGRVAEAHRVWKGLFGKAYPEG